MLPPVQFLSETDFSKLLSVSRYAIYMGLVKGEKALTRSASKLTVNSRLSRYLLRLESWNFWKLNKVFVVKSVTKIAEMVAKLTTAPLTRRTFFSSREMFFLQRNFAKTKMWIFFKLVGDNNSLFSVKKKSKRNKHSFKGHFSYCIV